MAFGVAVRRVKSPGTERFLILPLYAQLFVGTLFNVSLIYKQQYRLPGEIMMIKGTRHRDDEAERRRIMKEKLRKIRKTSMKLQEKLRRKKLAGI